MLAPTEVEVELNGMFTGGGTEPEVSAVQDVLDLIQVPQRRGIARADLDAARALARGGMPAVAGDAPTTSTR